MTCHKPVCTLTREPPTPNTIPSWLCLGVRVRGAFSNFGIEDNVLMELVSETNVYILPRDLCWDSRSPNETVTGKYLKAGKGGKDRSPIRQRQFEGGTTLRIGTWKIFDVRELRRFGTPPDRCGDGGVEECRVLWGGRNSFLISCGNHGTYMFRRTVNAVLDGFHRMIQSQLARGAIQSHIA